MIKTLLAAVLSAALLTPQTRITPPENKYTPAQDVELGRQAAAEAERQLPILRDEVASSYVESIGRRLVSAIPADLRHPEFRYSFEVVNVKDINAFALPGGPMFVNRGMIEAARDEGEVAGVMAHELSHVVLRHGTAQASKATKYEIGQLAGAVLGAIIGGRVGSIVAQGTQFGLGAAFLRFGREFERQADIEGSHIMARAGYDPVDMANMFKTIEKQGGRGGPEWLSDHPNPGNRYEYITAEAKMLRVEHPVRDTRAFNDVRGHLRQLPPALTSEQVARDTSRGGTLPRGTTGSAPTGGVEPPASDMRTYTIGDVMRVSVPANWQELQANNAVTFAPNGAYGQVGGQSVFTHGLEFGVARNETHDLQTATRELIDSFAQSNPQLRQSSGFSRLNISGRNGLQTSLSNVSEATGQPETIVVATTTLRDGSLLYAIAVAPRDEFRQYQSAFQRSLSSIRLMD